MLFTKLAVFAFAAFAAAAPMGAGVDKREEAKDLDRKASGYGWWPGAPHPPAPSGDHGHHHHEGKGNDKREWAHELDARASLYGGHHHHHGPPPTGPKRAFAWERDEVASAYGLPYPQTPLSSDSSSKRSDVNASIERWIRMRRAKSLDLAGN